MSLSKKEELTLHKQEQAGQVRQEKLVQKLRKEEERLKVELDKQHQLEKLSKLESDIKGAKDSKNPEGVSRYSSSKPSSRKVFKDAYAQHVQDLQERAKYLLNGRPFGMSSTPSKDFKAETLTNIRQRGPVKVPMYVPSSIIRKAQHLPPPSVHRTSKSGEVMTVHLVSDPIPAFDPLVKTEAQMERRELEHVGKGASYGQIIDNLQKQLMTHTAKQAISKRTTSLTPDLHPVKLPEQEDLFVIKEKRTPKGKIQTYSFRDLPVQTVNNETAKNRKWVSSRMKEYSRKIRQHFPPRASDKKQMEMAIRMEQSRPAKLSTLQRVYLHNLNA